MIHLKVRLDSIDGDRVWVTLFCGKPGFTLVNIGRLCMTKDEHRAIGAALSMGADLSGGTLTVEHAVIDIAGIAATGKE